MKAVIFDVDGTLVDSVDLHAQAWKEAFQHFGYTRSFDEIRAQIGKGGDQLMPVFLSKEEVEQKGEQIDKYRGELFQEKFLHKVQAFPQVRPLFQRLLKDGWKLALASSAKGPELEIYKEVSEIGDLLEAQTSSDDAEESKPEPDIFQAAMKRLGEIPPGDCVVVGDSPYDAMAAEKAGILSIGFLCGGFAEKELRAAGYQALYRDATDLLEKYEDSIFYLQRPSGK